MKAILEFNLPDDEWAFCQAQHGAEYRAIINQTLEALRQYRNAEQTPAAQELLEDIQTNLWAELEDSGLAWEFV